MGWRDEYRPGAFRGVPFHLKSSTRTGGRRTVLDEYPLRDLPSTQDMGRKARQFNLSMTVIGKDYMVQRDKLIVALEAYGPGTLMHPFYGEMQVALLGDYSIEESTEQGGLARISQNFVEDHGKPRPDNQPVPGVLVNQAADQVQEESWFEFEDEFGVLDTASFVADEATAMLGEATALVADAVAYGEGLAGSAISGLQGVTSKIMSGGGLLNGSSQFGTLFSRLTGNFQQLILSPGNLGLSLMGMMRSATSGMSPFGAFRAMTSLFNIGGKVKSVRGSGVVTPARAQQAANQAAVYRLIERVAVTEAARLATGRPLAASPALLAGQLPGTGSALAAGPAVIAGRLPAASSPLSSAQVLPGLSYDNREQAVQVRDQLLAELDRQQLQATPARYSALAKLTTALVTDLNRQSTSLAPLAKYQPQITQPALLIAHRLYGDARRADEIVARNRISHPGFVPGGQVLEVLKQEGQKNA
jgi:prophage DNA circulation protein